MSAACEELVNKLLVATDQLMTLIRNVAESGMIEGRGGPGDTLLIVERYRSELTAGVRDGSQQHILKAANLLTTVNRGMGDSVWVSDHPAIMDAALDVTRSATIAAQCLRKALEMPF